MIRHYVESQFGSENHDDCYIDTVRWRIVSSEFVVPQPDKFMKDEGEGFVEHIRKQILSQQLYILANPAMAHPRRSSDDMWDNLLDRNWLMRPRGTPKMDQLLLAELSKLQRQAASLGVLYNLDEQTPVAWAVKQLRCLDNQLSKTIWFASVVSNDDSTTFRLMAIRVIRCMLVTMRHYKQNDDEIWRAISDADAYKDENGFRTYRFLMGSIYNLELWKMWRVARARAEVEQFLEIIHRTIRRMSAGIVAGYQAKLDEIKERFR